MWLDAFTRCIVRCDVWRRWRRHLLCREPSHGASKLTGYCVRHVAQRIVLVVLCSYGVCMSHRMARRIAAVRTPCARRKCARRSLPADGALSEPPFRVSFPSLFSETPSESPFRVSFPNLRSESPFRVSIPSLLSESFSESPFRVSIPSLLSESPFRVSFPSLLSESRHERARRRRQWSWRSWWRCR